MWWHNGTPEQDQLNTYWDAAVSGASPGSAGSGGSRSRSDYAGGYRPGPGAPQEAPARSGVRPPTGD